MVVDEENNLKYSLIGWNDAYGKLDRSEEMTLNFYRISYKGEIPKAELNKALQSLDSWSRFAYESKLLFHVTAFLENDQPYADILFNDGNVIVRFIDEFNRIFLAYEFGSSSKKNMLFLNSLRYYLYPDDKKFYGRRHSIRDFQYKFTEQGKLTVWDRYLKDGKWYEEAKEAEEPVNVESNWEQYPKLGKYDRIINLQRWNEDELALPFRGDNPTTYVDSYEGKSLTKRNTPYQRLNKEEQASVENAYFNASEKHDQKKTEEAIQILEKAFDKLPEPKNKFKAASDIIIKIVDYHNANENFDEAFRILDKLEGYLNTENYDAIALYRAKVNFLSGNHKKAFELFQSFKIRNGMDELRTQYPEYNAIFQKLL